jgi:hypothetical protein
VLAIETLYPEVPTDQFVQPISKMTTRDVDCTYIYVLEFLIYRLQLTSKWGLEVLPSRYHFVKRVRLSLQVQGFPVVNHHFYHFIGRTAETKFITYV